MCFFRRVLPLVAIAAFLQATGSRCVAQFPNFWLPTGASDYTSDGNWSEGGVPSIDFQEVAVINTGGTAQLQNATPDHVGGVILGQQSGGMGDFSGTLEIGAGGSLTAVSGVNNNGAVVVSSDAPGTLSISSDGQLSAASIQSNASGAINLSGAARLSSTGVINLNGATSIVGQSATLRADQTLLLGGGSNLRIEINGASAPLMEAGQAVSLGGALEVDFGGAVPAVGSAWNIFDAGGVAGQFSQINVAGGSLDLGQRLRVRPVVDGSSANGVYGQLLLEQLLVLEVNRDTGAMTIRNPSGSSAVSLDSYAITSGNESLNTADGVWTSLTDQAVAGWIEANPQATQLAELNTTGATSVSAGGSLSLGEAWNPQYTQVGQNFEDLVFRYSGADGELINAPVVYTGANVNDVSLFVDPDTGETQLRNASSFPMEIEGYTIRSESMALTPGGWDSLEENADGWIEANPTQGAVSELKTDGVEFLSAHGAYNLGQLFDPEGQQDLTLEYLLPGQSQTTAGRVVYQELPPISEGVFGDYNGDGVVGAADYVVWRDSLNSSTTLPNEDPSVTPGQVTQEDYAVWRSNYGSTASSAGAAVGAAIPEPSAIAALVCGLAFGGVSGRRHSRRRGRWNLFT